MKSNWTTTCLAIVLGAALLASPSSILLAQEAEPAAGADDVLDGAVEQDPANAEPTPPPPEPDPVWMEALAGTWAGDNKLWLRSKKPKVSAGTAQVEARVVRYTWAYKGEPQSGTLTLGGSPEATTADWTDTWHAKGGMTLNGAVTDGEVALYTTYGKTWGWRIAIGLEGDALAMRMTNITPKGAEIPAVELVAVRQPARDPGSGDPED